jgi:hypothetical protein
VENPEANPLPPSLRTPVFRVALKDNPAAAVEVLKNLWYTTPAVDGKEICLSVLGSVKEPEIITKTLLPFLFNTSPPAPASDSIPPGDMHILGSMLGANSTARPIQWKYLQDNWDACVAKLGNPIVLDRFVQVSLPKFTDLSAVDEIDAFFKDKDTKSFDRTLETVKDKIRGRAAYKTRDSASLKEWLVQNGYTS